MLFGGRNSILRFKCYTLLLIVLSCFPLSHSQSCNEITVEFDGIGAGGYAHSITYEEDGEPVKIVPDDVVLTSTTNILSIQIVLGWFHLYYSILVYFLCLQLFRDIFFHWIGPRQWEHHYSCEWQFHGIQHKLWYDRQHSLYPSKGLSWVTCWRLHCTVESNWVCATWRAKPTENRFAIFAVFTSSVPCFIDSCKLILHSHNLVFHWCIPCSCRGYTHIPWSDQ